jgi:DNA-binding transcriptional LysR family regulator
MPDRLETMSLLVTAVEAGSLSAAARQLGMPLATLSRRLADFETSLGAELMVRTARGLSLTEAGETYVAACRRILEDVAEADTAAKGEFRTPRGRLTITTPLVFGRLHVLPVALEFLRTFPEIDLQIEQGDRNTDILEEHIDLAVRIGPPGDLGLIVRRVGAVRRVVCASPGYLAERGAPADPADLAHHACITFNNLMSAELWSFDTADGLRSVPIRSRLSVNTAEAAIDAAVAGLGLTRVLSYQVAELVEQDRLVIVLDRFEPPPLPVSLLHVRRPMMPKKVRAFLDFAGPRLSARLS